MDSNQLLQTLTAGSVALQNPVSDLIKLGAALIVGFVVTSVYRRYTISKKDPDAMTQAQILLCVSGALVMLIIGDSVARALGIAGGASIIRFRTPVKDPKDSIILFLMLALGMACGLGAYWAAGLGTAFLSGTIIWLNRNRKATRCKKRLAPVLVASSADSRSRRRWDARLEQPAIGPAC